MANHLTDKTFWVNYWADKRDMAVQIPANYLFHRQLQAIIAQNKVKTAIELGGFPGYYAVFLKKYFQLEVTFLDQFVHLPLTTELFEKNGLSPTEIRVIEADLFNYVPEQQYDLVLSCGLIEHFKDTADIINRHITFLKPGGSLFITLPNFKSLNGWFQKTFDKPNYDKHNISSMNPAFLAHVCQQAGLELVQSRYFGNFSIWLENEAQKPAAVRIFKKITWLAGKLLTKALPFNSRQLSPYIILEARRKT